MATPQNNRPASWMSRYLVALVLLAALLPAHPARAQFVCSAGARDGADCETDDDCLPASGGACVVVQGVCQGGPTDGFPCDCPSATCGAPVCADDATFGTCSGGPFQAECCDLTFNCDDGAPCVASQKVCCSGIDQGFACLNDNQCTGGGSCLATGKFCDGGDFDSFTCCDASDCLGGGECVTADIPPPATPTFTPRPPTPTGTRAAATPTANGANTATVTRTAAVPATRTPTMSSAAVAITAENTGGGPGDVIYLVVSLTTSGTPVTAITNDLRVDPKIVQIEPIDCRLDTRVKGYTLNASDLEPTDPTTRALRVFLSRNGSPQSIGDGLLYACAGKIVASADPGDYPIRVEGAAAANAAGSTLSSVRGIDGSVKVTLFQACSGDCNFDGKVTIDEAVRATNIATGRSTLSACQAADSDRRRGVDFHEVVEAVGNAERNCR